MDLSEFSIIRSGVELLDLHVFGVPFKNLLDLLLMFLVAAGVAYRGGKLAYRGGSAVYGLFRRTPITDQKDATGLPADECKEEVSESPAFRECLASLSCWEPTYNSDNQLICAGLIVKFASSHPQAPVASLTGVDSTQAGRDLAPLLSESEYTMVVNYARELRDEVIARDKHRDNQAAAQAMRKSRMQAMSKQMKDDQGGDEDLGETLVPPPLRYQSPVPPTNRGTRKVPVIVPGQPVGMNSARRV